jgi:hypothetical protein
VVSSGSLVTALGSTTKLLRQTGWNMSRSGSGFQRMLKMSSKPQNDLVDFEDLARQLTTMRSIGAADKSEKTKNLPVDFKGWLSIVTKRKITKAALVTFMASDTVQLIS